MATTVAKRVLNSSGGPSMTPSRFMTQVMPVTFMNCAKTPPSCMRIIQAVVRTSSEVQKGSSTKIIRMLAVFCGVVASM